MKPYKKQMVSEREEKIMMNILVGWAIFGLMLSPIMLCEISDIIDWLKDKRDKRGLD